MSTCQNCLLPDRFPGLSLDDRGVCSLCHDHEHQDHSTEEAAQSEREADLERALETCRGDGPYDCLMGLSGGKDSCYLLYKLKKELGLSVLAYTVNINIPDIAWDNIRRTVKQLDVPHMVYTPPIAFYKKMFRYLLSHQGPAGAVRTVCYSCAPLTESYAIRTATEKNIPLILMGYSPGQPEPDRMMYEFSRTMMEKTDWTPPELRGAPSITDQELGGYWNPADYPAGTRIPRFLAPFHAWEYSQEDVIKAVVELGLVRNSKHASPVYSNCPVNWLLMYSDLKHLGYNSYMPEFARLIREGKASRGYWRVMMAFVNWMIRHKVLMGRHVTESLNWLEIGEEDLCLKG